MSEKDKAAQAKSDPKADSTAHTTLGWWSRRRLRKQIKHSKILLESQRDLINPERRTEYEERLAELTAAVAEKSRDKAEIALARMAKLEQKIFSRPWYADAQDYVDVVLVAAIVAYGGMRTFFFMPFQIPTASMEPTLNGVEFRFLDEKEMAPSLPRSIFDYAVWGRSYIDVIAKADGELSGIREIPYRKWLLFPSQKMEFYYGDERYVVPIAAHEFSRMHFPSYVHAGDSILRVVQEAGSHPLVDRFTYNFRRPERGEIAVFDTTNMPVQNPGWFYIKRINGVGGDELRIEPPRLWVNGKVADSRKAYERIYSMKEGYHGYVYAPPGEEKNFPHVLTSAHPAYRVPEGTYFCMGDNSANSADSRYWGPVPHQKFIGKAFFVYWPFTPPRWGPTD